MLSPTPTPTPVPAVAPTIVTQPVSVTANAGANAAFWVVATGTPPLAYQWNLAGSPIAGATSPLLLVPNAQASSGGAYTVTVTNSGGTASSTAAQLTVNAAATGNSLKFIVNPVSQTLPTGSTVVFTAQTNVGATAAVSLPSTPVISARALAADAAPTVTLQWFFNMVAIAGATGSNYVIANTAASENGTYTCVATDSSGAVESTSATLNVVAGLNPGRLVNVSCRANAGTGANELIMGYVVGGQGTSGTEPLLIRASGPALAPFGVTGFLPDPQLTLGSSNGVLESNNGWAGSTQVAAAATLAGAFSWSTSSSHDAALIESLPSGAYTAQVAGASGDSGVTLAEVYDTTPIGSYTLASARLVNVSARATVGAAGNILIAGFAIEGSTSRTVLIRSSGPALAAFGVPGTLPDPQLQLYRSNGDGTSTLLLTNTGWGGDSTVAAAAASVGAFSWGTPGSADSAVLVTLPPGAYTAEVSGASGDTGVALVEVYEVP